MTIKVGKNIEITSLAQRRGKARLNMPFGSSYVVPEPTAEMLAAMVELSAKRSLQYGDGAHNDPSLTFDQVNPTDSDFIYPMFRALSAVLIDGYFLDFTKEGLLEAAVPMMLGQTIYTNHVYWDVTKWIGAVSQSLWDPKGDKANGTPGINVELKIDWKMNPKIARGLLMTPPAIHSVSATLDFEWDASHPDLLEVGTFWRLLGQEVDGQIVRLIVTAIRRFYELSLVFQGADTGAKELLGDEEDTELSAGGVPAKLSGGPDNLPPSQLRIVENKETKKVKLTLEQKTALGLAAHEGDEVDDAIVLTAVDHLAARATAATSIIDAERADVLRLATLAECKGDEKLADAIATTISKADAAQLPGLKALYAARAEAQFTSTCPKCHTAVTLKRSSVEDAPLVEEKPAQTGQQVSIL